jgi:hypothetical protein
MHDYEMIVRERDPNIVPGNTLMIVPSNSSAFAFSESVIVDVFHRLNCKGCC